MRYRMLALDLDGTLLDPLGRVSDANASAVAAARGAGLRVVVCTGRGLIECDHILRRIEQRDPVVVAGGSIIACPVTQQTLHRFALDHDLVRRGVEAFIAEGQPALILKDPVMTGYDYLVVRGPHGLEIDPVTRWWFDTLGVKVRYAEHLHEDEHPEHTVRIGVCGGASRLTRIAGALGEAMGPRATVHSFPCVAPHGHTFDEPWHVLELFDGDANKWTAISHLAERWGVAREEVAAIGDQINDETMIRHAGLGVAMANAMPGVKAVASRHTLDNASDGVAHAIDHILAGRW